MKKTNIYNFYRSMNFINVMQYMKKHIYNFYRFINVIQYMKKQIYIIFINSVLQFIMFDIHFIFI